MLLLSSDATLVIWCCCCHLMLLLSSGATLVNSGAEISLIYHPSKDEAAHQTTGHSSHTHHDLLQFFLIHIILHQDVAKKCKGEHLISGHFSKTSCLATPGITRNLSKQHGHNTLTKCNQHHTKKQHSFSILYNISNTIPEKNRKGTPRQLSI